VARRSRRWTSIVTVGLFAAILAVAGVVVLLDRNTDDGTAGSETDGTVAAIVPQGSEATPVDGDRVTVSASTFLAPAGDVTYDPGNIIDGDLDTAWNSDAGASRGVGQQVVFRFVEPLDLKSIRFVNGYTKNDQVFAANHRIQRVQVTTDDSVRMLTLLDTGEAQEVTHDFGFTSKVELEILEVYEGAGFNDPTLTPDLALTEVSFVAVQSS
jgi:hypothetical protein